MSSKKLNVAALLYSSKKGVLTFSKKFREVSIVFTFEKFTQ
jgi:hypothetical protein